VVLSIFPLFGAAAAIEERLMDVEEVVAGRFAEIMGLPREGVDLTADLQAQYGVTSIKALKLINDVEVTFDVDIEEDEARQIKTLHDVVRLINEKR
jgi:acyl carrier protein